MGTSAQRPIKVMHIIARMNVGGPAVEIVDLMRGLDPGFVSQRLVTGYCADDEADYLETQAPDIRATRIDGLGRSVRPTDDLLVLARLIRVIRDSRPDIVHTHTAKAGVLGRIAAKAAGTGVKIVHTHHGHLLHGYFGESKTRAVIQLERQLSRITDSIITVGDKVRDDLIEAGIGRADQYSVIRSGVKLGPLPDKHVARRELGLPDGPVIVTMLGRLTQIKRPDRFADVVEITKSRGLNVHYLVVGSGDQEPALRQRVTQGDLPVTMLGWRSDLERILAATDIVLLTSDNEGVPLAILEACQSGIPVVSTRVGSVSEVVHDGITGLLTTTEAPALAAALMALVGDPVELLQLGKQARELCQRECRAGSFLEGHHDIYESLF